MIYAGKDASELFKDHFRPWVEDHSPSDLRLYSEQRLGKELTALRRDHGYDIEIVQKQKSSRYTINRSADTAVTDAENVEGDDQDAINTLLAEQIITLDERLRQAMADYDHDKRRHCGSAA